MWGGTFSSFWVLLEHGSFTNNSFNNSVYLTLNPSTTFLYDFNLWNRKFTASASAFLPIMAFVVRPAYGSPKFEGYLDNPDDKSIGPVF